MFSSKSAQILGTRPPWHQKLSWLCIAFSFYYIAPSISLFFLLCTFCFFTFFPLSYFFPSLFVCVPYHHSYSLYFLPLLHIKIIPSHPFCISLYPYILSSFLTCSFSIPFICTSCGYSSSSSQELCVGLVLHHFS